MAIFLMESTLLHVLPKKTMTVRGKLILNLLEFCNKSGLCGPFDDDVVVLIDSDWMPKYKNLSCQLFTTCSNFISTFGIQIIVDANNRQYSYHSGDLSIPSQSK